LSFLATRHGQGLQQKLLLQCHNYTNCHTAMGWQNDAIVTAFPITAAAGTSYLSFATCQQQGIAGGFLLQK